LPGGMLGRILSSGPRKTTYEDFEAPKLPITEWSVEGNSITGKISADPKTTKIEMHIDGKLVKTFTEGFDQLKYTVNGGGLRGSHEITFYAFDRFLNCGSKAISLNDR
jgi:hypothetical protein